jgi:hypothetical protein
MTENAVTDQEPKNQLSTAANNVETTGSGIRGDSVSLGVVKTH